MNVAERIRWFNVCSEGFTLYQRETVTQDTKVIESVLYPQAMQDEYNKRTEQAQFELAERNIQRPTPRIIARRDLTK